MLVVLSDELLPRQSSQAQAAEDILDKYRNIKRPSASDGAAAGASYDGAGGQFKIKWHLHITCTCFRRGENLLFCIFVYFHRSLCWRQRTRLSKRRQSPEYVHRWPPRLGQPDSKSARLQVLFQVKHLLSYRKPLNTFNNHSRLSCVLSTYCIATAVY